MYYKTQIETQSLINNLKIKSYRKIRYNRSIYIDS
uniref:Uncharacterized protein n=1 Tax=Podoviridae sp. ct8Lf7 TaxID=2827723 RepID=A0A8S5S1S0_9CAUD|nr:MAG TPA: hypothetical protein [Podoviridae sp. ct8Lf7]